MFGAKSEIPARRDGRRDGGAWRQGPNLGGGLGGEVLSMILGGGTVDASGVDSFLAQILGGGIGGGLLMAIVGILRQTLGGPTASA